MPNALTALRLCGDAAPLPLLAEAANRHACSIWQAEDGLAVLERADAAQDGGPMVLLIGDLTAERLGRALRAPVSACVEVFGGRIFDGPELNIGRAGQGLYLGLSTASAYALEPARFICEAVGDRLGLSEDQRMNIDLALHEAVVNALTHGSLELSSAGRQTVEDFMVFCESITDRLADARFAQRRLEIVADWDDEALVIAVTDEGPGYDFQAQEQNKPMDQANDPCRKSGRGLNLIRDLSAGVEISQNGRRLSMRFAR